VGSNAYNTTFFIGWDEPGGTYDHVPPGPVPPPDPATPPDRFGFTFNRSGYRVPAVIVSPWVDEGSIFSDEYRHTSMIATLRQVWGLGAPLSDRDAQARTFQHLLTRDEPRHPDSWPVTSPLPVPDYQASLVEARGAISTLGKHFCHGLLEHARRTNLHVAQAPPDPKDDVSPTLALDIVHRLAGRFFPLLEDKRSGERPAD
jgi:phospholipase C